MSRIVVWFSAGAASATAAYLAIRNTTDKEVILAYCDPGQEHPDNERFIKDCEQWLGKEVLILSSDKYKDVWDVWRKTRYLVGPRGARCTTEMKKKIRHKFEQPDDVQVFGYTVEEKDRLERFKNNQPDINIWCPLIDYNVTKAQCLATIKEAGIELPVMYKMGYKNNNCIGCPKGGAGYWNKIRNDFPEVFDRMAKLERELGVTINSVTRKGEKKRVFLDELDPDQGRYKAEPEIKCGIFCGEV